MRILEHQRSSNPAGMTDMPDFQARITPFIPLSYALSMHDLHSGFPAGCDTFPVRKQGFVSILRQKSRERVHAQ
jgi:hypothetical protein